MRSLQVLTPHKECIYHCPFCISKTHKHQNIFENNYKHNYDVWKDNLIKILKNNNELKYIVITGTNEPMQDRGCVSDIISIIRKNRPDIQIEMQTRMYQYDVIYEKLDVVAYSISDFVFLNKIKTSSKINRYVILLTDSFNNKKLEEIVSYIPEEVTQLTFKALHNSNGENESLDDWILNHKIEENTLNKLIEDIGKYKGNISIRYDENCMNSFNRYMIFREDGKLYQTWEDI